MKIYSYIINYDYGFSPNPFWGICSLACCKPRIRQTAKEGDWIVGIRGKGLFAKMKLPKSNDPIQAHRIVYAMKVSEVLSFDEYFDRFPEKRPDYTKTEIIYRCGDNIYKPLGNGDYEQLKSLHEDYDKLTDLGGKFVLISSNFYYFGSVPIEIPDNLKSLIIGIGHKIHTSLEIQNVFLEFISSQKMGVNSEPSQWKAGDASWKQ